MVVDLGCGTAKHGDIGIDCHPAPGVDYVCDLGFEPIPLPDNYADKALALDFLEHIPPLVVYKESGRFRRHYPLIQLLNEVYRILKPDGILEVMTPRYDAEAAFQDPTHVAFWTPNSLAYFCEGNAVNLMRPYGYAARFILLDLHQNDSHLFFLLRACKPE